jgi:hypothetical protein
MLHRGKCCGSWRIRLEVLHTESTRCIFSFIPKRQTPTVSSAPTPQWHCAHLHFHGCDDFMVYGWATGHAHAYDRVHASAEQAWTPDHFGLRWSRSICKLPNFVSDFQVSPTHAINGLDGGEVRCADGILPIGLMSRISSRPRMDPRSGPISDTSILHTWRIYDSLQCLRFSSNCDR